MSEAGELRTAAEVGEVTSSQSQRYAKTKIESFQLEQVFSPSTWNVETLKFPLLTLKSHP